MYSNDTITCYTRCEVSTIREGLQEDLKLEQNQRAAFWNDTIIANHFRLSY